MSSHSPSVPFVPRSAANCLDLAVMYCGRRLPVILTLWACAAVPACVLVYVLTYYFEFDLRLALLVIYAATATLGGWLIAAITPALFSRLVPESDGGRFDAPASGSRAAGYLTWAGCFLCGGLLALWIGSSPALAGIVDVLSLAAAVLLGAVLYERAQLLLRETTDGRIRPGKAVRAALVVRLTVGLAPIVLLTFANGWTIFLAIVLALLPGIPLAARYGFAAEKACLKQLDRRLHHRNTDALIQSELGDLLIRLCGIGLFFVAMWMVLFFTVDLAASLIFQFDILTGRLGELDLTSERFWIFLGTDPLLLTTWTATALLAYPIARLAWFLCYIDVRVRRDCWDLELSLSREAGRLKETA